MSAKQIRNPSKMTNKHFAAAIKQIRNASNNLHLHANETGDHASRQANLVLARLSQCLEYGDDYLLAGLADQFDAINAEANR